MPKAHSSAWLNKPARPNNKISPKPTTKGGVMIGSMASTLRGLCSRVPPRSAHKASKVPMTVVPKAVISASHKVFQATPQRLCPLRQAKPQTRSVATLCNKWGQAYMPASSTQAATNERSTGYTTNKASSAEQLTTAAATNTSPLKPPRRAKAAPNSTTRLSKTSAAPQPMPYWPLGKAPHKVLSDSTAQPVAPMAKPLISKPSKPIKLPSSKARPCWRAEQGTHTAAPHTSKPANPDHSQERPCCRA